MENIIQTTLMGLFFGTFGTTIGGVIGATLNLKSNKILSFILQFAAGLMLAIVAFELIPEALELAKIKYVIIGSLFGVAIMLLCENIANKKIKTNKKQTSILKTGIIVGIGLALHNIPEGLSIGAGFGASYKLGISLAIAIAFHDIPEGISMAVPMKAGGISIIKVILLTFLSGITTGIGAFFGGILGTISKELISFSLAFAAGAMLYIVSRRTNTRIK